MYICHKQVHTHFICVNDKYAFCSIALFICVVPMQVFCIIFYRNQANHVVLTDFP